LVVRGQISRMGGRHRLVRGFNQVRPSAHRAGQSVTVGGSFGDLVAIAAQLRRAAHRSPWCRPGGANAREIPASHLSWPHATGVAQCEPDRLVSVHPSRFSAASTRAALAFFAGCPCGVTAHVRAGLSGNAVASWGSISAPAERPAGPVSWAGCRSLPARRATGRPALHAAVPAGLTPF
jgi:hypothetical protein